MLSLLHLENEDEAMIVGIYGLAGIGKTTIARALHSRLSSRFQLSCFMENVSESYNKGLDDLGLKLSQQEQLLSNILNQNGKRKYHLGTIQERLHDKKVLIILDDVDHLEQLEALAYEASWFGPGSRIIVTTNNQEVLEQHDINITYHVDFPTKEDAREILCRKAFRRGVALDGYEKLVERVTKLCGNLPLGLHVIGSTLRGKKEEDWECILHRLENSLDRKIEGVLRVGYDKLHMDDQRLFLFIAFFFNYKDKDYVKAMVAGCNLEVGLEFGLKNLAYRSVIQISTQGKIVMHKLLQQVGREANQRQDQGKRQILIDNDEICDVLENDSGSRNVMGISLDVSTLSSDVYISSRAFKRTCNIRFFDIYKTRHDTNVRVHIPEDMNFPSRLRLLNWGKYPGKCIPPTFRSEFLVELNLENNELERLWEGIQPLRNLKKMNLEKSMYLKELPNLSNASNLESLNLNFCIELVEIPSSIGNLQKLEDLYMGFCLNLLNVPTHLSSSPETVYMFGCYRLRKIPGFYTNITTLFITDTMLQDLHESVRLPSRLRQIYIHSSPIEGFSGRLYELTEIDGKHFWERRASDIKDVDIEKLPDWIKDLDGLQDLQIVGCPKLASLPELPASLRRLHVTDCKSLETLMPFPPESAIEEIYFNNCLKLGEEARKIITQQSNATCVVHGTNVPAEFEHRAIGSSLTIPSSTYREFKVCVVLSPKQGMGRYVDLSWRQSCKGFAITLKNPILHYISKIETEHLCMVHFALTKKLKSDVLLEFSTTSKDLNIIECGFQFLTNKTNKRRKWKKR